MSHESKHLQNNNDWQNDFSLVTAFIIQVGKILLKQDNITL